ncbi:transposase, partial [Vagococcus bubulae]
KALINAEETGKIYKQRKIDVEPAFGNLKANLSFTRFSVRGKDKVVNELGFALMAINIRKLTAYRQLKSTNELKNKDLKMIFSFLNPCFFILETFGSASFFSYCSHSC